MTHRFFAGGWPSLIGVLICGAGVLIGAGYLLLLRRPDGRQGVWRAESVAAFRRRIRRRRFGAALTIAVSIAVAAGLGILEPKQQPLAYMIYWLIVFIMLAWILGLGLLDLLQTRRMFRRPRGGTNGPKSRDGGA